MDQVKEVSCYRQSGWKHLETGVIEVYYGECTPQCVEHYEKVWDNMIESTIVKSPYVAPTPA